MSRAPLAFVVLALGCAGAARFPSRATKVANPDAVVGTPASGAPVLHAAFAIDDDEGTELPAHSEGGKMVDDRSGEPRELGDVTEDHGLAAYAQRPANLFVDAYETLRIGWLEAGARVGVIGIEGAYAHVVLFPWGTARHDPNGTGRATAWARVDELGAAPPAKSGPAAGPAGHERRLLASGQYLDTLRGDRFGYSFCGEIEVIGPSEGRVHAIQRADGIAIEGLVDATMTSPEHGCPAPLLVDIQERRLQDGRAMTRSVRHVWREGRARRWRQAGLPPSLVPAGPFVGPSLAQLTRVAAPVYWLHDDRDHAASCTSWRIERTRGQEDASLVSRSWEDGDMLVTRFGLSWFGDVQSQVTLLGPHSEVIAPPGRAPRFGGLSFACGSTYTLVASSSRALTMLRTSPPLGATVVAFDPRDAERWYLDRASCDADARSLEKSSKQTARIAFAFHEGC